MWELRLSHLVLLGHVVWENDTVAIDACSKNVGLLIATLARLVDETVHATAPLDAFRLDPLVVANSVFKTVIFHVLACRT